MTTFETTIRTTGWNKQIFKKAEHSNLADACNWIIAEMPHAELVKELKNRNEKYGAIVKREGQCGIVTSLIAFYQ